MCPKIPESDEVWEHGDREFERKDLFYRELGIFLLGMAAGIFLLGAALLVLT